MKFLFFLMPFLLEGQNYFVIQKKRDPSISKKLYFDNLYTIKTTDTTYISRIVKFTDSTLLITKNVRNYDSIKMVVKYPNRQKLDTVYNKPYWRPDTIALLKQHIQYLEKDLLKNRKWLDPFTWVILGGGAGVLMAQTSMDDLSDGAQVGLGLTGGILGITVPVIYIGTRRTKFDMNTKWVFAKK